jgi:hypothetical protein
MQGKAIASGPQIVIEERSFDFKAVEEGPRLEHSFRVSNQGDQILEIRRVKTS